MALKGIYPKDMVGVQYEVIDSTPRFRIGENAPDNNGGQWEYVKFTGTGALGDCYWVDESGNAVTVLNATTPASQRPVALGIAQVANTAANSYGWLWLGGFGAGGVGSGIVCNVLISCVKDVPLYCTATAGKLDDSSTSHYQVLGLCTCATEPGTGTAAIEVFASLPLSLSGI